MRSNASPEAVAAVVAASLLEAAWITIVYVLVESLKGPAEAPLSMLAFAGAATAGIGFARWSADSGRHAYRSPVAAVTVVLALCGWLLPLGSDAARVLDDPAVAFSMHPGGILLGLAFLRGTGHLTRLDDERIAEVALGPGLAAVAVLWVFLAASGGTDEAWVVGAASGATVTFVTAGLASIGLARLADLRGAGVRGADRRIWDGVLIGVIVGLLVIALPLALILGVPFGGAVRTVAEVVAGVIVIVATPFIWVGAILGQALYLFIVFLRGLAGGTLSDPGGSVGGPLFLWPRVLGPGSENGLALGIIPLVVAIVVAFILIRAFVRRSRRSVVHSTPVEDREFERPTGMRVRRPRLPIPRRQLAPRSAREAYVASLDVLAQWPELSRLPSETPAEHARRVRSAGVGPSLSRLAADYALVEFGQRRLTPSEDRRAIERWRRIRATDGGGM